MPLITWNSKDLTANVVLSNNDLTATWTSTNGGGRNTHSKNNGKWYLEIKIQDIGNERRRNFAVGVTDQRENTSTAISNSRGSYHRDTWKIGTIVGIALDIENNTVFFYENGEYIDNLSISQLDEEKYIAFITPSLSNRRQITANFGAEEFDIVKSNPNNWEQLIYENFLPYDIDNAEWFSPIKINNFTVDYDNQYKTTASIVSEETDIKYKLFVNGNQV